MCTCFVLHFLPACLASAPLLGMLAFEVYLTKGSTFICPLSLRVLSNVYIHGSPSMNATLDISDIPIPASHPRMVASFEVLSTRSHTLICAPRLEGILGVGVGPNPPKFLFFFFILNMAFMMSGSYPLLAFEHFLDLTKHALTLLPTAKEYSFSDVYLYLYFKLNL